MKIYSIWKNNFFPWIVFFFLLSTVQSSFATIELMSDNDLSTVDAQLSEIRVVNHNQANDTVRIFLDIHQEVYGTIDSAKVGYYYKDSADLATTPLEVGLSGYVGFYHGADNINNGANFDFLKITSDFNTMAPANGATLEPWGNGGVDTTNEESLQRTLTPNCNNFDWDIWADNLQLGESPDKPQYVNGLIIRMEFDNSIYSSNPHLERLVIGTNDAQGNLYFNAQRLTGVVNGLLVSNTTNRSAGPKDPYQYTGGTIILQRDPFIQSMGVVVQNVEDRDTGLWLTIDFEGDHLGFNLIGGLPENATFFNSTGSVGSTGLEGIDVWDASWAPCESCNYESGMTQTDPYNTTRQEDYESE